MPLPLVQEVFDPATHTRRGLVARLAVLNVAIALLLSALVYLVLDASRQTVASQTRAIAENLAAIAKLNIESELGRIDAVLSATADEIERLQAAGPMDEQALIDLLASRRTLLPAAEALRMSDATGRVRWGTALPNTLPGAAVATIADRPYFKQAMASTQATTLVTEPLRSQASGHWIVVLLRPLRPNGTFSGVLYVSLAASHFEALFDRYAMSDHDAVTLRNTAMQLIARRAPGSASPSRVGEVVVSPELRATARDNPNGGFFVAKVALDQVERATAYRAVEGWPFVVYAGLNNARFLTPWRHQAVTVSLLAALCWLLVALASLVAFRASVRQSRVLHALAEQTRQMQALLRVAADGLHILDREGRLVEMSDSFAEMLRSTRERLLGRHVSSWDVNQDKTTIDAWLAKIAVGDKQRVEVQHLRDDGTVIEVELQLRVTEISGELMIFAAGRDITQVKQLLHEQTAMLESDLVGMVRVEGQTIGWRNQAFERLFGYAPGELAGMPLRTLYPDDDSYREAASEAKSMLGGAVQHRMELRMRRKTGERIWLAVSGVRLSHSQTFWMAVDITAMKQTHAQLAHAASHDPLTGLPNRVLLRQRLQQSLAGAAKEGRALAVCYMDLDGFKAINDQLGHEAGDLLLVEVAQRLRSVLRPGDDAFRIGGDEFVLVLAPATRAQWQQLLDRLLARITAPIDLQRGQPAWVHVTIGVATSEAVVSNVESLLDQADEIMLRGKRSGKGRVWWS